jgi:hypothetical protein
VKLTRAGDSLQEKKVSEGAAFIIVVILVVWIYTIVELMNSRKLGIRTSTSWFLSFQIQIFDMVKGSTTRDESLGILQLRNFKIPWHMPRAWDKQRAQSRPGPSFFFNSGKMLTLLDIVKNGQIGKSSKSRRRSKEGSIASLAFRAFSQVTTISFPAFF